jgi:hypothetical protein
MNRHLPKGVRIGKEHHVVVVEVLLVEVTQEEHEAGAGVQ